MTSAAVKFNLSFSGCGFLGMYHLGVAKAMCRHGNGFMQNVERFGGASAGALAASILAVLGPKPDVIEKCIEFCMNLAKSTRELRFGVLSRTSNLLAPLEKFLDSILPQNAHRIASGRLYISVTECGARKKNEIVSEFESRDELIKYLLASSCILHITSPTYVTIKGKKYCDGGLTNNLPRFSEEGGVRTVLVSPFDGRQDICPSDDHPVWLARPLAQVYMSINEQIFRLNMRNITRGLHTFAPPHPKELHRYYVRGVRDTVRFLRKENLYESSSVSSSESNQGEGEKERERKMSL